MPTPTDKALWCPDRRHWHDGAEWWPTEAPPERPEMTFNKLANSVPLLVATFALLLFGSAIAYSVYEHTSYFDAVYWSIVTMTTLGYGDLSPHTGRESC